MIGQLTAGGAEKQVALLAKELSRRGVATSVLLLFRGGPREAELVDAGVEVVHLGFGRRNGRRAFGHNLAVFARMVGHLRRTKPDVLHAFLFHSYLVAAPAAWLARVPAMVAGRRSLGYFKEGRRLMLALERVANWMTDLVVANAEAVAADVYRQERLSPRKVAVVYNGLPEPAFAPAEPAEVITDLPVVLCVANLKWEKGHKYLVDAVGRLRDRSAPCTLVLAGAGTEEPALCRQAAELGVDVRFLGTRWDVDRLLARADVAVLPSLTEGMPNAVMEAMAAGTPVVATTVGGTPELLRGRGVLVPSADPQALADGLYTVLSDREYAGRLAREAQTWSRTHLHVDVMVDQHLALYAGLLRRRGVRPVQVG
ncbi:glycosyltransferase [Planosporangium sp. 12N6]|uniref:glycosyltransferase n=1 Tax=Planosporangium spinosum TaxID=3402278 RepID=UPI003CF1514F